MKQSLFRRRGAMVMAATLAALGCGPAAAAPMSIFDFALFGAAGVVTTAGADVQIGSSATVNGNVGSNEDVNMNGSSQVLGNVYAGRDFTMGINAIVGSAGSPSLVVANRLADTNGKIFGDLHASGNETANNLSVLLRNSSLPGPEVTGNVYGQNNLRFNSMSGMGVGGNVTVGGGVQNLASNTIGGSTATGSTAGLLTFAGITAPAPTLFTSSALAADDRACPPACTLAPGTYSDLTVSSGNVLTLTSGTYKFQSMSVLGNTDLFLDLSSGNPLNIYVTGLADFGSSVDVFLKGPGDAGYTQVSALGANTSLASLVYLETYTRFVLGGSSEWAGTVYASVVESGAHETDLGGSVNVWGGFYAYDTVEIAGSSTVNYVRSYLGGPVGPTAVPEPATFLLLGAGLLGVLGVRRSKA